MKAVNSYYGIKFTMSHTFGYGVYLIEADYKGKHVKAYTSNSEAFDYYKDDSNREKHRAALRHCYNEIREAYETFYN